MLPLRVLLLPALLASASLVGAEDAPTPPPVWSAQVQTIPVVATPAPASPAWLAKAQPIPGDSAPHALGTFPDGSALVVFRGHTADGSRDLQFARWSDSHWSEPRVLLPDGWKPAAAPAVGPSLATLGNRAAAAWFTIVDDNPRIQVSLSSDAGHVWQIPLRVSEDTPEAAAAVAVALLRDESEVVCWQEGARLLLRRLTPRDDSDPLTTVAALRGPVAALQLTVQSDKDDNAPVRILVNYTDEGKAAAASITIPSFKQLAALDTTCACEQHSDLPRGFLMSGAVISRDSAAGTVTVKHGEVPGVMPGMTMPFRVAPEVLPTLDPGREFLGQMEERDGAWWLFDVRLLQPTGK